MHASFFTLGQVIKFAFDATGVLPRKRSERAGLDERDIKRIQKQLERLIDEEGSLSNRCEELIQALAFEIAGTIRNQKVSLAIGGTLADLLGTYCKVICDDGTYLSPRDSLRWFCGAYAIPGLVLSIHKHTLRLNIHSEGFLRPEDDDWYLPTITGTTIKWPLEKVMNWVYEQCQTSRTQFHNPGRVICNESSEGRQNLDNAANWIRGKTMPSWPGLHWNFARSIDRLMAAEEPYKRSISERERESFLYVLFLARFSTYLTKLVHDVYGAEVLSDMVSQFKRHRKYLVADLEYFKSETSKYIKINMIHADCHNLIWLRHTDQYWESFNSRLVTCAMELESLLKIFGNQVMPDENLALLFDEYGEYAVHFILDLTTYLRDLNPPDFFPEALLRGFDLKKCNSTTHASIDVYETEVKEKGLTPSLEWMVHWNRAVVYYKNRQDQEAFMHIQKAFELARYAAGKNQYAIVNQYIELAAKNDSWKVFKKGVFWADYLGLSVRWLRGKEPTEDNLRATFELMKKGRYLDL